MGSIGSEGGEHMDVEQTGRNKIDRRNVQEATITLWDERDREEVKKYLQDILQIVPISWEFTQDGVEIDGLSEKGIYVHHPKTAKAFCAAFLLGYNCGFGNGRKYERGEEELCQG